MTLRTQQKFERFTALVSLIGGFILIPFVSGIGIPLVVTALTIGGFYALHSREVVGK